MTFRKLHQAAAASPFLALAIALPAAAQDTPWSGFYVGANIGGNWGNSSLGATVAPGNGSSVIPPQDVTLINASSLGDSNKTGFTGGIEGGYNYQAGSWLFGLESDFVSLDVAQRSTANFQSAATSGVTYTMTQRANTSWMWTLRPRVGYVAGPWLVYGTAGWASSDIKVSLDFADNRLPPNSISSNSSKTKNGWVAGGGLGFALSDNISVKGEYLYADFGNIRTSVTGSNGFVNLTSKATVKSNILRAGIDYRF